MKALECPDFVNYPTVRGARDDPWVLVVVKDVQVHFVVEEFRYDLDLEFRWLNRPPEEMVNKWNFYRKMKKKAEGVQIDEDFFRNQDSDEK
jgi:hypothetical protein